VRAGRRTARAGTRHRPGPDEGTAEAWLNAYDRVCQHPELLHELPCPNCGDKNLNLVFLAFSSAAGAVSPAFWCGTCLYGMPPARALLPGWARAVPRGEENVPNYRIVGADG